VEEQLEWRAQIPGLMKPLLRQSKIIFYFRKFVPVICTSPQDEKGRSDDLSVTCLIC